MTQKHGRSLTPGIVAAFILTLLVLAFLTSAPAGTRAVVAGGFYSEETCVPFTRFDPRAFPSPTRIDNRWLPLTPGMQFVLEGTATELDTGMLVQRRVTFTVTDLTKVIAGVRSLVVWDTDHNDGQLAESELAFFAQDGDGNVWSIGEYPEEFEGGVFQGAPNTWMAGTDGAEPGVIMLAAPTPLATYSQGLAPAIEFLDCAEVGWSHVALCGPVGCFLDVLQVDERSPLERESGVQRKSYAPGIGNVQIDAFGDRETETLMLIRVTTLTPEALAAVREEVLRIDARALEVSEVYRSASPPGASSLLPR